MVDGGFACGGSASAPCRTGSSERSHYMQCKRMDHEPPEALARWGWRYHHIGIPTKQVMPDERYLPAFRMYVSGFGTSPFGIEWMRFEEGSSVAPLIKAVPHPAFEVDDLDFELSHRDLKILTPPNPPSEGVRVAMIEYDGAPVELIEFSEERRMSPFGRHAPPD